MSRANTVQRGIGFTAAIGGAIGILWLSAAALSWTARRVLRPSWPFPLRQGIASLYRPGNQTRAVVLALGFGVFLMGTLYQVQHNILRRSICGSARRARTSCSSTCRRTSEPGIDSMIRAGHNELIDETPIVPMRIASINGRAVADILARLEAAAARGGAARTRPARRTVAAAVGMLRREFRSTTATRSPNRSISWPARWFTAARATERWARCRSTPAAAAELGVQLRDTITWNVQGVLIPTVVTSLREVKWQSFSPNFFAVFDPASLEKAPKQFAILVHAPDPHGDRAPAARRRRRNSRACRAST